MDRSERQSDPPWHTRTPEQRMTDAALKMSASSDRVAAILEKLEHRMAIQPSAPMFEPKTLIARAILVSAVSALIGACTALAWTQ